MTEQTPQLHTHQSRPPASDILRSFVGGFLGISGLALSLQLILGDADLALMIGTFGATAVLVYGVPYSPLAQPYNVVFGHLISAAIGVAVFQIVGEANWLSAALAVSLAIAAMQASRSVHPPGGATALIAVIASPAIHELGFLYIVYPVGFGAVLLVGIALITNNVGKTRRWPIFWR